MSLVAGERMERTLDDFVRACEVLLDEEQSKVAPNNALIAVLCDAVRLTREYAKACGSPWQDETVRSCGDCPLEAAEYSREADERISVCNHPKLARHERIEPRFLSHLIKARPAWCPLDRGVLTLRAGK